MSMLRGTGVSLYSLTLSPSSMIHAAVYGNFSAPRQQDIVVSLGKVLQLLRPDARGQLQIIASTEAFGMIRSVAAFRLPGTPTDYIVIGSDSGRIVILKFDDAKRAFMKVHQETYGRSGCRRIVPGQLVACDPAGRAIMVAAVEKQKFVYVLNRDSGNNLTISSPLEAHKSKHIVYAVTALDNGFDNPLFAAIELDYRDADEDSSGEAAAMAQKELVFYELDLGLNLVVRKWSSPCDNGSNLLISVPGDNLKVRQEDLPGPGGVVVCAENFVIYMNDNQEAISCLIPRRDQLPAERQTMLCVSATHKMRNQFVILAQSEYGDIYKITLVYNPTAAGSTVTEVKVKYFDTIPVAAAMCILKTGFLFAASEAGDHGFYEFQALGDEDGGAEASSNDMTETEGGYQPIFFSPRPLTNLALVSTLTSLAPMTDMKVANMLGEEVPQLFCACGRSARSSLRMLRPGLTVSEVAVTDLPARPTAVWTVRKTHDDPYDDLIVISFVDDKATLVLRVGETVQEVNNSGLEGKTATVGMQLLGNNAILQVHQGGLRLVNPDRRINKWAPPGRRTVIACATNKNQVVIALSGSEIIYFELNHSNGQLLEVEKREIPGEVACMGIATVPEGRQRSQFVIVGCYDNTCRVLSLEPSDTLQVKATQSVASRPASVQLLECTVSAAGDAPAASALFLHIALENGVLIRTEIDQVSGKLIEQRSRFLGTGEPVLLTTTVAGSQSMLALSSRPWLGRTAGGSYQLAPLAYERLDHAAAFASEMVPEGIVAVVKNAAGTGTLRVLTLDRLSEPFTQQVLKLAFTPRKVLVDDSRNLLYTIEAEHGTLPYAERTDLAEAATAMGRASPYGAVPGELIPELQALEEQFGAARGDERQWASCLRVVDPRGGADHATLVTASVTHLDNNEAAICMCLVSFASRPEEGVLLAVGTAKSLSFFPRQAEEGYIRLYRFDHTGRNLQLLHTTATGGLIPAALTPFQGKLLVGAGHTLRLMELGKKKLLRKCEFAGLPNFVVSLHTMGERVYVGDAQESFQFMKYRKSENLFYLFGDDQTPRYISCSLLVDYDTMAGGDKFGNVFLCRLPSSTSLQVEEDPTGGKFATTGGLLNSAAHKIEPIINFHVGDLVTSLQMSALQQGGQEMIVCGTISGGVFVLLPFTNTTDLDLFEQVEMHMRQLAPSLVGRDHLAFRSSFFPVKDVVDGDLCEQFVSLTASKQSTVAGETDRTVGQLIKKLEDMRNKVL